MENEQQSGKGGSGRRPWAAYNIVERSGRHFWNRVGSAFQNHDGSMNIYLDALPRDGKIQIRDGAPELVVAAVVEAMLEVVPEKGPVGVVDAFQSKLARRSTQRG